MPEVIDGASGDLVETTLIQYVFLPRPCKVRVSTACKCICVARETSLEQSDNRLLHLVTVSSSDNLMYLWVRSIPRVSNVVWIFVWISAQEPHREPCDSGFGLQPSECLKRSWDAQHQQRFDT